MKRERERRLIASQDDIFFLTICIGKCIQEREGEGRNKMTRKLYVREVTSCLNCPSVLIQPVWTKIIGKCDLAGKLDGCLFRKIDNLEEIPDWCPLEDAAKGGDPD